MVWGLYGTFARLGLAVASVGLCMGCSSEPVRETSAPLCSAAFMACQADPAQPIRVDGSVALCGGQYAVTRCEETSWCSELPKCTAVSTGLCCP